MSHASDMKQPQVTQHHGSPVTLNTTACRLVASLVGQRRVHATLLCGIFQHRAAWSFKAVFTRSTPACFGKWHTLLLALVVVFDCKRSVCLFSYIMVILFPLLLCAAESRLILTYLAGLGSPPSIDRDALRLSQHSHSALLLELWHSDQALTNYVLLQGISLNKKPPHFQNTELFFESPV